MIEPSTSSTNRIVLDQQYLVDQQYPKKKKTSLYKWDVNGKEVSLIRKCVDKRVIKDTKVIFERIEDKITCEIFDPATGKKIKKPAKIPFLPQSQYQVVLNNDEPNFCAVSDTWFTNNKKYEVKLLVGENELIWQLFDIATNKTQWADFQKVTSPSQRCHSETIKLLESIKKLALKNAISAAGILKRDFTVFVLERTSPPQKLLEKLFSLNKNLNFTSPFQIRLEPITKTSRIDERVGVESIRIGLLDQQYFEKKKKSLYKWDVNGKEVSLIRKCVGKRVIKDTKVTLERIEDKITCEIFDPDTGKKIKMLVPAFDNYTTEEKEKKLIPFIHNYQVVLNNDEADFYAVSHTWLTNNKKYEVKLLIGGNELIWQLFDIATNKTQWADYQKVTSPSQRCHLETIKLIESIKEQALKNARSAAIILRRDFTVSVLERTLSFQIRLEPITETSRIDERVEVTKSMWAITMTAGPDGNKKSSNGNHARIVIEGINDGSLSQYISNEIGVGEYFMITPHFTGSYVKIKNMTETLIYDERTPIWKITRQKIEEMLKSIQKDVVTPPKFSIFGNNSIFSLGRHNCFTWARAKFSLIDIKLGKSSWGWIASKTKRFTLKEAQLKKRLAITHI